MDEKNQAILKKLAQQRAADIKERDKQRREVETKAEKETNKNKKDAENKPDEPQWSSGF